LVGVPILAVVAPVATLAVGRLLSDPPDPTAGPSRSTTTLPNGLVELVKVTSAGTPQPGQRHRSSGNFSIQDAPPGTSGLLWRVEGAGGQEASFAVMEDKPVGFDPVVFDNVTDGLRTGFQVSRSLYVADPRGVTGETFTVTVLRGALSRGWDGRQFLKASGE
jgi:hypothetical protein